MHLRKTRKTWKTWKEEVYWERMVGPEEEPIGWPRAVVRLIVSRTKFAALGLVCGVLGHDWEDDSYGGPETGCMAGHCNRCGYSFHNTLY